MPLEIAAHAGFCMGVRRAVEAAENATGDGVPTCTLGELIHNPIVVQSLRSKGIEVIDAPEEAKGRRVLIRSHGVSPDVIDRLTALDCFVMFVMLTPFDFQSVTPSSAFFNTVGVYSGIE